MRGKIVLLGVCLAGLAACADVYSNVYFWTRGMATDQNGNGVLEAAEGRDSLNRGAFNYGVYNAPVFTNEWAHLPYRGTTNYVQSLYFPQSITVTDEATGAGYGYPSTVTIPNARVGAVINSNHDPHYTIYMRIRPDAYQAHPSYCWLFHFGHGTKRGLMVGFNGCRNDEHKWGSPPHFYTNRTAAVLIYYGGSGWSPGGDNGRLNLNNWNDLVISVDGQKIRLFLARDGYIHGFDNNYDNSSCGGWHTYYGEMTAGNDWDLTPASGAVFRIGAENPASGKQTWVAPAKDNGNHWKTFRGSVQTLAIWTNSMTLAEMREVAAYPRMDKWRVGLDDGSAAEFKSAAAGASIDVEGDEWAVPALAAGESCTFRFPLDASGDAKMNQFFRIKGAPGCGNVSANVTVNGTLCDMARIVRPGRTACWWVPSACLRPNATNTLVVTCTSDSVGTLQIDSARFGGSIQYSEDNGNTYENNLEGRYQYNDFDLIGANWFDGNRAIFGGSRTNANYGTSYTNQLVRFYLPDDLANRGIDYKVTCKPTGGHKFSYFFNGHTLAEGVTGTVTYDLPAAYFQATNEFNAVNVQNYVNGSYSGIDYIRFNMQKPIGGTIMFVR